MILSLTFILVVMILHAGFFYNLGIKQTRNKIYNRTRTKQELEEEIENLTQELEDLISLEIWKIVYGSDIDPQTQIEWWDYQGVDYKEELKRDINSARLAGKLIDYDIALEHLSKRLWLK